MNLRQTENLYSPIGLGATLLGVSLVAACLLLMLVITAPYVGFDIRPTDDGQLQIIDSSDTRLNRQFIVALHANGQTLELNAGHVATDTADRRQLHASLLDALVVYDRMHQFLGADDLKLQLANGRMINHDTDTPRALASMSGEFWLRFFCGLTAWLVGAALWVWQPGSRVNQLSMIAGLGLMLTWLSVSLVYADLPLFYQPLWISQLLFTLQSLGIGVFATAFTCLFIAFPNELAHRDRVCGTIALIVGGYFLYQFFANENWVQARYMYGLIPVLFATAVTAGLVQWITSAKSPRERERQLLFVFAATLGPALWFIFYWLPVKYDDTPYFPMSVAPLVVLASYALAIFSIWAHPKLDPSIRIETIFRWWMVSLTFLTLDVLIIALTSITARDAMIVTLIAVLWVYLPLRQWSYHSVTSRETSRRRLATNHAMVRLLEDSYGHKDPFESWQSALVDVFDPLECHADTTATTTTLKNQGRQLHVAPTMYSPGLVLGAAERGKRQYVDEDLTVITLLSEIFEKLFQYRDAFEAGRMEERQRISRDLHDQIGSKLLSVLYLADNPKIRDLARETMDQLGEMLRALKTAPVPVVTLEAELKQLSEETCENTGLTLNWNRSLNDSSVVITSSNYLNLMNIVRELLNNTVRHAEASNVTIMVEQQDGQIQLRYADNGRGFNPDNISRGNGLRNIEDRALEMEANVSWSSNEGVSLSLTMPVPAGIQSKLNVAQVA